MKVIVFFFFFFFYVSLLIASSQIFSTMNIVKTKLRNKIEDEFVTNSLMVYIEREVVVTISINLIINIFGIQKNDGFHFDICFG
jgi:hypothetical protein